MRIEIKKAILISIIVAMRVTGMAQGIRNNGANWVITTGATVYVDGDANGGFLNENGGLIDLDGDIVIEGNWTNDAANSVFTNTDNDGWVRFKGTSTETIDGTADTRFEYIEFNNSASGTPISLSRDVIVEGICRFTDGVVVTGANYLIIESTTGADVVGHSSASFVNGNLRRFIAPNTETYPFPVGDGLTASDYYLAELINGNLTGFTYIDAKFGALLPGGTLSESEEGTPYTSVAAEGVWYIDPDIPPIGGEYDLKCFTANIGGLANDQFTILSRPTPSADAADWACNPCGFGDPGINANGGAGRVVADGYALRLGMTKFSQKGIGKSSTPLPIELVTFFAECEDEQVKLSWTTASESNNDFFTIEKSINSTEFTVVDIVNGAGTTGNVSYYNAYDDEVSEMTTYYRLKQTDFDGKFTYSDLVITNCNKEEEAGFAIMPNPATDFINIVLKGEGEGDAAFAIFDGSGKRVYEKMFYGNFKRFTANIESLAAGMYYARLIASDCVFTEKFIKF
jgi:hypothetical protein